MLHNQFIHATILLIGLYFTRYSMNIAVLLFFIHNILATLLLGYKFFGRKDGTFKNFGIALLLDSAAFAVWTIAVLLKPTNLDQYVTIGAAFFIASLVFLLITGTQNLKSGTRGLLVMIGVISGIAIFYTRTFIYPSAPAFSPEGLFFFHLQPLVQMIYIFGLAITALPAIDVVASKFNHPYSALVKYGFIAEVVGGIILITSLDVQVLYIIGWIIGASYIVLWPTLIFSRKAWKSSN